MKVRIIGSGSMWNEHNSASYMVDDNILIDVPNGSCKNLFRMGINPNTIENVLITHFHGDHFFDMPFYMVLKSRGDNKNINVYCSKEGKNKISKILKLAFPNSAKSINEEINLKYSFNASFLLNNYKVEKFLVDHGRMKPAYAYILESEDKKVGFTGDTTLCEPVEKMASICDYVFCDCMFIEGTTKHMGINQLKYLIEKYPKFIFVVSHLENNTRDELNKLKLSNVIVPNDGMIIDL